MGTNADTVRKIEEAWDSGRLDELDQHFVPDFDNSASAAPGVPLGLEGAKMVHQGVMQGFPDRKVEILDIAEEGDRVFVRTRVSGTNTGGFQLFNVPGNGNAFQIDAWSLYRFNDEGKVVAHWGINDALSLGIQLGAFPAPGA